MKSITNIAIVGCILALVYLFAGHGYVKFLLGGKSELLEAAARINALCNAEGSCPTTLEGWRARNGDDAVLSKGNMLYFPSPGEGREAGQGTAPYPAFRLVHRFFLPDHWFEARGGTGREVTSGWESR